MLYETFKHINFADDFNPNERSTTRLLNGRVPTDTHDTNRQPPNASHATRTAPNTPSVNDTRKLSPSHSCPLMMAHPGYATEPDIPRTLPEIDTDIPEVVVTGAPECKRNGKPCNRFKVGSIMTSKLRAAGAPGCLLELRIGGIFLPRNRPTLGPQVQSQNP